MSTILRFPSPFEVETPAGCEGWEAMYPSYMRFSQARRESEESRLWFYNGMHFPEPISPFDVITAGTFFGTSFGHERSPPPRAAAPLTRRHAVCSPVLPAGAQHAERLLRHATCHPVFGLPTSEWP